MITLSFLQLLQDNDLGVLDESLFFQKMSFDKKEGISIVNIGEPKNRGSRTVQSYELLSRGSNDVTGYKQLEAVRDFIVSRTSKICKMPDIPRYDVEGHERVKLMEPSTISSIGPDANERVIYSIQGRIIY